MYVPPHFQPPSDEQLVALMREHNFALLVTQSSLGPQVSQLPLLYTPASASITAAQPSHPVQPSDSSLGVLRGHWARLNPQWHAADGQSALAVFTGPHAYISPAWYQAEQVVPTWNYVTVQARGSLRVIEDPAWLAQFLADLVAFHEAPASAPWTFDPYAEWAQRLARHIVGFELVITELHGKWKLSQNHSTQRRGRVAQQLAQRPDDDSQAIARLMQAMVVGESNRDG